MSVTMEADLIDWIDRVWATPCMAQLPPHLHGLCRIVPAAVVMVIIFVGVLLLSLTNPKPAQPAAAAKTAASKPAAPAAAASKKGRTKKTD